MTKVAFKVIDSWAMVAWVGDESAAPAMQSLLEQAEAGEIRLFMSIFNVGETFYTLAKRINIAVAEEFLLNLSELPVQIDVPDAEGIIRAARIKALHPIAYGDSFAISLAQEKSASVITGDDEIRRCGIVPVEWIAVEEAK